MAEPALPESDVPLPALHASHAGSWLCSVDGTVRAASKGEAVMAAADTPHLILNAPLVATRLGYPDLSGLDLLELFAFVHPARFCVPTPKGLAHALDLPEPEDGAQVPRLLRQAAGVLLATCEREEWGAPQLARHGSERLPAKPFPVLPP